eukprot:748353-Hanusia_phi.AAC.3
MQFNLETNWYTVFHYVSLTYLAQSGRIKGVYWLWALQYVDAGGNRQGSSAERRLNALIRTEGLILMMFCTFGVTPGQ